MTECLSVPTVLQIFAAVLTPLLSAIGLLWRAQQASQKDHLSYLESLLDRQTDVVKETATTTREVLPAVRERRR